MHYYTHNIGEFAVETRFLSPEDIGVYVILKDEYFSTGMRLACDRIAELMPPECEASLKKVLARFFTLEDGFYVRAQWEKELAGFKDKGAINSENAKKRWAKRREADESQAKESDSVATVCDSHATRTTLHAKSCLTNNQEPITNNQRIESTDVLSTQAQAPASTPVRRRKTSGVSSVEKPDDIPAQVWSDWLQIRKAKRLPLTKTAWDAMLVEAEKVGYSAEEMVRCCVERGWASFKAQWLINEREKNERAAGMPPKANRPLQRQDLEDLEEVPL